MISYRTFRNWDPPALVELWNASTLGRGAARSVEVQDLDRLIFSKPYFDAKGIIVAEEAAQPVGFVHAGFGATSDDRGLCRDFGVIAMLVVLPAHRRRGIARELVRRAEQYLRESGSTVIYAGGMHPLDPFYLGLYGGSEMPGILRSDSAAHQLFQSLGYRAIDECVVFQRSLTGSLALTDPKSRTWSRQGDFFANLEAEPENWWSACRYSTLEHADFGVRLRTTGEVVARARGWEMFPMQKAWGADAVGLVDVQVVPEYRNQGLGTFLLNQILRHYRDRGLTLAEVQTMTRNEPAKRLYQRLGFVEVDRGVVYRKEKSEW